jgi:hypothetical protein
LAILLFGININIVRNQKNKKRPNLCGIGLKKLFDNDPKHMKQVNEIETTGSFLIMAQRARCNFCIFPKSKASKSIDAYKELFKIHQK